MTVPATPKRNTPVSRPYPRKLTDIEYNYLLKASKYKAEAVWISPSVLRLILRWYGLLEYITDIETEILNLSKQIERRKK